VFNDTSTHKGQFVPTAGGGKPARSANDGQQYNADYLMSRDNNVKQFTVKHSHYTNATTGYLIS